MQDKGQQNPKMVWVIVICPFEEELKKPEKWVSIPAPSSLMPKA